MGYSLTEVVDTLKTQGMSLWKAYSRNRR